MQPPLIMIALIPLLFAVAPTATAHGEETATFANFTFKAGTLQELTNMFATHLEVPFGCYVNTDDMPEDAPSRNLAALWLRAAFHDVGKYDPAVPDQMVSGLLAQPDFLNQTENAGTDFDQVCGL
jgi:hypothetical protein